MGASNWLNQTVFLFDVKSCIQILVSLSVCIVRELRYCNIKDCANIGASTDIYLLGQPLDRSRSGSK